jgi:6-phospho-beta-glucosidase
MRTVIVGGSSQSTPALFDTEFTLGAPRFGFDLIGRSTQRLAAVKRAIDIVGAQHGVSIDCRAVAAEMSEAAITGADVVLIQLRVGGYAARAGDETFPHRYGVCGDEGLGPGGLAAAWRTWEELRAVLATVVRCNPQAFVLLLTSPVGILTRCAREAFPALRVYGICELPWTTLNELCAAASADVSTARYSYVAVNHLGWFSDLRTADATVLSPLDVHPLKYVRLHDFPTVVLKEQQSASPRAQALAVLASEAFAVYAHGSEAEVLRAVRRRGTPWYAHAVAPFLRSLAGDDTGVTYFLSAPNDGYCASFGADEVIEMPFVVREGKLERRATVACRRDDIAAKVGRLVAYERAATDAVLCGDRTKLATALRAHPWLDGLAVTDQLIADVVAPVAAAATSFK